MSYIRKRLTLETPVFVGIINQRSIIMSIKKIVKKKVTEELTFTASKKLHKLYQELRARGEILNSILERIFASDNQIMKASTKYVKCKDEVFELAEEETGKDSNEYDYTISYDKKKCETLIILKKVKKK